ncbi:rRNA maturation RNase YbeY [Candidatus Parcubacteria bacterium]|nr:rRNA maturation RNase YbeY [Candidatus Parcubacteria bacterium]
MVRRDKKDKVERKFSILNTTKSKTPVLDFMSIKNTVLGKSYELSLVFIGDTRSHRLNLSYRGKDKPTDVLSFPLSKASGEIFINLKKSARFGVGFLFIHGILHLKGFEHGVRMENEEKKLLKKFRITLPTTHGSSHSSRNRYRHISS